MRTLTWVALMGAVVGAAGCGGQSRKELTKKANAICARFSKQGAALGSPDLTDPAAAKTYFTKAATLAKKQQDELEGLDPSGDAKDDFDALTSATGRATKLLDDLAAASGDQTGDRYRGLVKSLSSISDDVDRSAQALGAQTCAG